MMSVSFVTYLLKSALALTTMYLCWRILLRKEAFHRANRYTLISITILSLLLPLYSCTIKNTRLSLIKTEIIGEQNSWETLSSPNTYLENGIAACPGTAVSIILTVLAFVYWSGVAIVFFKGIVAVFSLLRIRNGGHQESMPDGTIVVTAHTIDSAFSWMSWIYMPDTERKNLNKAVYLHEKAHITLHHSFDILVLEFLVSIQWFNPSVWMLIQDLRLLHEYEADEAVLCSGFKSSQYQSILLEKAATKNQLSLSNSFSKGSLKSRFLMMGKKGSPFAALKYLYFVPFLLSFIIASANIIPGKIVFSEHLINPSNDYTDSSMSHYNILNDGKLKINRNSVIFIDGKKCSLEECGLIQTRGECIRSINIDKIATFGLNNCALAEKLTIKTANAAVPPQIKIAGNRFKGFSALSFTKNEDGTLHSILAHRGQDLFLLCEIKY